MTIVAKRDLVWSFCDNNSSSCKLCKLNCGGWKHQNIAYECPSIENMDESELDRALNLIYADNKVKFVEKEEMTAEQANRILHPDTTFEALAEIESYAGFNGKQAKLKAVDDACIVACEALEKRIPKAPVMWYDGYADGEPAVEDYECPSCGAVYNFDDDGKHRFCPNCGQSFDWSE